MSSNRKRFETANPEPIYSVFEQKSERVQCLESNWRQNVIKILSASNVSSSLSLDVVVLQQLFTRFFFRIRIWFIWFPLCYESLSSGESSEKQEWKHIHHKDFHLISQRDFQWHRKGEQKRKSLKGSLERRFILLQMPFKSLQWFSPRFACQSVSSWLFTRCKWKIQSIDDEEAKEETPLLGFISFDFSLSLFLSHRCSISGLTAKYIWRRNLSETFLHAE